MRYQTILNTVATTPWALLPEKLAEISEFLAVKAAGGEIPQVEQDAMLAASKSSRQDQKEFRTVGNTAVIPILGTILNRETWITRSSGITTAKGLKRQLDAAMDDKSVNTILLDIDSPGGTADGIADLAADIRRMKNQKPIYAVVDGIAASAGYYLASQASRISITQTSEVGSIGVFVAHRDISKALEKEGIKINLISAGKYKTEMTPFAPLTEEARKELQTQVDYYFGLFLDDVAKGRQTTAAVVKKEFGQGRMIRPQEALKKGMIDAVESSEVAMAAAIMDGVKKASKTKLETIKEFETFLRDAGLTKKEAVAVANHGFKGLSINHRDDGEKDESILDIAKKHFSI